MCNIFSIFDLIAASQHYKLNDCIDSFCTAYSSSYTVLSLSLFFSKDQRVKKFSGSLFREIRLNS